MKKKKNRQKMVVGKKEIGKKVWSVKKKSAKIVSRQKILVTQQKFNHFLPTFFLSIRYAMFKYIQVTICQKFNYFNS